MADNEELRQEQPSSSSSLTAHIRSGGSGSGSGEIEMASSSSSSSSRQERQFLLQGIFFLLGVGILMPWNAFISAKRYFESRQCGGGHEADAAVVDKSIESTFAVVSNLASMLCLGFIITLQWIQDRYHQHHHHHQQQQQHHHGVDTMEESPPMRAAAVAAATTTTITAAVASERSNNIDINNSGICASDGDHSSRQHAFWLVMVPLAMYVMVFMLQTILVLCIDIPPQMFRTITLASLIACGICGSLAQVGIVATAGLFDTSIGINPYLAGQSAGGLAVSICNFLAATMEDPSSFYKLHCSNDKQNGTFFVFETLEQDNATSRAVLDATHTHSAAAATPHGGRDDETCAPYTKQDMAVFSYFMAGSVVLVACLIGYAYIDRYQNGHHRGDYETVQDPAELIQIQGNHHTNSNTNTIEHQSPRIGLETNGPLHHQQRSTKHANNEDNVLADRNNDNHEYLWQTLPFTDQLKSRVEGTAVEEREEFHDEDQGRNEDDNNNDHDDDDDDNGSSDLNETQQVWSIVQKPATCIFLVFFVTLGLFPGWVSQLHSAHKCRAPYVRLQNDLYTPAAFCLFNSGDLVGRILAARLSLSSSSSSRIVQHNLSNKLVMGAMARFIFFPLFFLCVGGSRDGQASAASAAATGFVIHSDLYSLTIQSLFSVTNGLLLTTAFAHAPSLLANVTHEQERSSEILNFAVVFGLLMGSLASVPIVHLFD